MMYPKPTKLSKKKASYKALYAEIWNERTHECAVCGQSIQEPVVHNFAHIKSKGAHPSLKMDKANIEILCSTVNRLDGDIGCHESSHSSNNQVYKQRLEKRAS